MSLKYHVLTQLLCDYLSLRHLFIGWVVGDGRMDRASDLLLIKIYIRFIKTARSWYIMINFLHDIDKAHAIARLRYGDIGL